MARFLHDALRRWLPPQPPPRLVRWVLIGGLAVVGIGIGYCAAGSKHIPTPEPGMTRTAQAPTTTPEPGPPPDSTPATTSAPVAGPVLLIWDYAPGLPDHTGFRVQQCEVGPDQQCTMQAPGPLLAADVRSVEVTLPRRPVFMCVEVIAVFNEGNAPASNRVCLGQ